VRVLRVSAAYRTRIIAAALLVLVCNATAQPQQAPAAQSQNARAILRSLQMVSLPAGRFQMGDGDGVGQADERPVHEVSVPAFRLSRFELTIGQFRRFVNATAYRTDSERNIAHDGCHARNFSGEVVWMSGTSWRTQSYPTTEQYPVACVSWIDAQAFVEWLNRLTHRHFRLPTEAEWEYAARAGSTSRYPWGSNADEGCRHANGRDLTPMPNGKLWDQRMECSDGHYYPAPVGSYQANAFGLQEMIGNVSEWIQDCRNDSYDAAPSDGSAWITGNCAMRAVRGGTFTYGPQGLRSANRVWSEPDYRSWYLGMRLAEDIPKT
jgi:formylglycine-generating enzyme required for sulfatase activity